MSCFFALVLAALLPPIALAQGLYTIDTRPPRGFMPTSDQLSSPLDNIDTVNGKLHIQVPLASLPRGRAGVGFELDLMYDSHVYDIVSAVDGPHLLHPDKRFIQELTPASLSGGWTYSVENYRLELEEQQDACTAPGATERKFRMRVALGDGSSHILHLRGYGGESWSTNQNYNGDGFLPLYPNGSWYDCQQPSGRHIVTSSLLTYYTSDGSYLKLELYPSDSGPSATWTLYFPDGRRIIKRGTDNVTFNCKWDDAENTPLPVGSTCIFDANERSGQPAGNRIRVVPNCFDPPNCTQTGYIILDDANRELHLQKNVESNPNLKRDIVTVYGPNGPISWTVDWMRVDVGGDGRVYKWADYHQEEAYEYIELSFSFWAVKYVHLPLSAAAAFGQQPTELWNTYEFQYVTNGTPKGFGELSYARTPSVAVYDFCCRQQKSYFVAIPVMWRSDSDSNVRVASVAPNAT